jgi:hypothetical protein
VYTRVEHERTICAGKGEVSLKWLLGQMNFGTVNIDRIAAGVTDKRVIGLCLRKRQSKTQHCKQRCTANERNVKDGHNKQNNWIIFCRVVVCDMNKDQTKGVTGHFAPT